MAPKLLLKDIVKTFNGGTPDAFQALKSLNVAINEGDFVTLIGGNGAGKSTLLNTIAGSFPVDSGKILIDGIDVTGTNEEQRAQKVSRVFQEPRMGTAPRMTVAENLALAYRRGKKRRLKKAVTADKREYFKIQLTQLGLGLENRLDTAIGLLSGGQRQAISLLMATLINPDILLLDEHTAALDPKTSRLILELTSQRVQQNHLTSLMITHNLQDAITYGNRMLVLDHGEIRYDLNASEKQKLTPTDLYVLMEELSNE